ncbi:MAG: XRE family transcriptional regulator [Gammaproteobacteria bacterium]|nr:XRE family transcriptional regulator [Gammaproteobacteria bacterium]MBU1979490.1 XRE family transcriptional regulator [Gammaproteobacteria bacterium]
MSKENLIIEPGSGNVFADLGFPLEEAQNLILRAELINQIEDYVASSGMTQQQSAKKLGVTQPRLNLLLKGKINEFSIDVLVNMAAKAGMQVEMKVKRAA